VPTVTISELAQLLEFSQQRVSDMVAQGMPATPGKRGKARLINVRQAVDWLIARAVEKVQTPDGGETMDQAELRKARSDADMAALKTAQMANQVLTLEEVEQTVERVMVMCASQLDGLGGRVAARLAAETDSAVIRQVLFDECRRIRAAMAAELQASADTEAGSESDPATADEDSGPVGGPVPGAAAGKRGARPVAQ
jgi:phage terminase Nu1 subunit (DNA packaging protein)